MFYFAKGHNQNRSQLIAAESATCQSNVNRALRSSQSSHNENGYICNSQMWDLNTLA